MICYGETEPSGKHKKEETNRAYQLVSFFNKIS